MNFCCRVSGIIAALSENVAAMGDEFLLPWVTNLHPSKRGGRICLASCPGEAIPSKARISKHRTADVEAATMREDTVTFVTFSLSGNVESGRLVIIQVSKTINSCVCGYDNKRNDDFACSRICPRYYMSCIHMRTLRAPYIRNHECSLSVFCEQPFSARPAHRHNLTTW
eukprot:GEMP01069654.1.p1 GENE.GEMP01069654.1~~GEMP01069654.1.p1  ORF type:complete len:169 (+),score=12.55 GEMP01069654.1:60-566(+)